jgi:pimeloyl-ACP methyl ester carboxylesterase
LKIRISITAILLFAVGAAMAGEHAYKFSDWSGPELDVRLYLPEQFAATTPIVIVMHGWSREAQRYFDDWKAVAAEKNFVIVVPHFPVSDFETANDYNQGHVFDKASGTLRPPQQWTFAAIEALFDNVVERIGSTQAEYILYGHSAGAQFVHRYLYYVPDARVQLFIAANAGWYTMPEFETGYPYGLRDSAIDEQALSAAFGKNLVLLLGKEDVDFSDPNLRNTAEAKRQGVNRFARGLTMYDVAKRSAAEIGTDFNWRLVLVEDANHSNAKMTPAAASLIVAERKDKSVLFVGNSFTYYNNGVHDHLRKLLSAANADGKAHAYLRIMTISGGELPEHESGLQQRLASQSWDQVILQGHSIGPITPGMAEPFRTAARAYAQAIRDHGAEPVFFMTWAYTGLPEMTAQLDMAYTAIGAELDAVVVPVGLAFATALELRPQLALVIDDRKHPTLAGTYLAACTFYAALYETSPAGLSYAAGLAKDDAGFLQEVAWETWLDYKAR